MTWPGSRTSPPYLSRTRSNTLYVRQTDLAGNVSGSTSVQFVLDTTGPEAGAVSDDTVADTDGSVTFTVGLSEPVLASTVSMT